MAIVINQDDGWIQYTSTGGETSLETDFPVFDDDDIIVIESSGGGSTDTVLTKDTHYSFDLNEIGVQTGGTVSFLAGQYPSGLTSGYKYTLISRPVAERLGNFLVSGDLTPDALNLEYNKITMALGALRRDVDQALRYYDSGMSGGIILRLVEPPEDGKALQFDGTTGTMINGPDTAAIAAAAGNATAAAASAAAALVSENNSAASEALAAGYAAAFNLPAITGGDALKVIRINAGETGYEYVTAGVAGTGDIRNYDIGNGLVINGSDVDVDVDDSTVELSGSTLQLKDNGATLAKMASGTADKLLGYDASGNPAEISLGTGLTLSSGTLSPDAVGHQIIQRDVFTSSGTWTKPAGCTAADVIVIAGGGGGGADATSNGGAGGTSSFGSHCSATGGSGGKHGLTDPDYQAKTSNTGDGGSGGAGSSGDINMNGQNGVRGWSNAYARNNLGNGVGGDGGSSSMGLGGRGGQWGPAVDSHGESGENYGSGGGGASRGNGTSYMRSGGGGGAGGEAYEFITSGLGATETVTVGAGGSKGNSTYDGGTGAGGIVIVTSYT